MGGEVAAIAGALDPRFSFVIPSGYFPDMSHLYHGISHNCWQWNNADIREYVDLSDYHALTAPRPLLMATGKGDDTYSQVAPVFAAGKQVARRTRAAYGSDVSKFIHYLHYDAHYYHVGDVNPTQPGGERFIRVPTVTAPTTPYSTAWQSSSATTSIGWTLFDFLNLPGSGPPVNLALQKAAAQSSTLNHTGMAVDARAVDGNTDGDYFHASVSHTNSEPQAWWQLDLGQVYSLEQIRVWNRTDCCGTRLSNFYIFLSDLPFASYDLNTTINQAGVSSYHVAGAAPAALTQAVNRTGRFVRVQLVGTNYLSLAEVEVWGVPGRGVPTQNVTWTNMAGVAASGNSLTKTAALGWGNAGASSMQTLASGDGYVEFTAAETNTLRMCGLSLGDAGQNYTDIDFAFYSWLDGVLYVFEGGQNRGIVGNYASGDRLRVSVEGNVVKYRKNGQVVYTSTITPAYPLLVDTSLYSNGSTLNNVVVGGAWQ